MKAPSAPQQITWIIGLVCGIGGIIGHYTNIQILTENNYLLLLVGFIALALVLRLKAYNSLNTGPTLLKAKD